MELKPGTWLTRKKPIDPRVIPRITMIKLVREEITTSRGILGRNVLWLVERSGTEPYYLGLNYLKRHYRIATLTEVALYAK